ncbi:hypothetical protein [Kribbella ginsengisoli]|uniref:ATP-binding protein n=1 Tax=Kribbella ginsengisoli TaxID=363865 RepID=A0ABP6VN05_9ACTN
MVIRLIADGDLTVSVAESWLEALSADRPAAALLDLSGCRSIHSGAGWRIGNALRRFDGPAGYCEVIARAPANLGDDKWWYRNFTRSGLGYAIGRYAAGVTSTSGTDVTRPIREYYERIVEQEGGRNHGLYGLAAIRGLIPSEEDFNSIFRGWISEWLLSHQQSAMPDILLLCWEAVTNLIDHSGKAPLPPSTRTFGSVSVRWYTPPELESAHGRYAHWLAATRRSAANRTLRGYLTIVVTDDGVGIAARQSQDPAIYRGDPQLERAAVLSALADGGTIKTTALDSTIRGRPGSGFTNIASSLRHLGAWALLRTGRHAFEFDGSRPDSAAFELSEAHLAYMPGTCLEVTVPVPEAGEVWAPPDTLPIELPSDRL